MSQQSPFSARRLIEADRPPLLAFLRLAQVLNQSLIDQVAAFGLSESRIAVWGAFRDERLRGVALVRGSSGSLVASDVGCLPDLVPLVSSAENLSGDVRTMDAALALLPAENVVWSQVDCVCRLAGERFRPAPPARTRQATASDLPGLAALYAQSDAFRNRTAEQTAEHIGRQFAGCRYFVVEDGERIAAAAAVVAETATSAMIVSVFTAPGHRIRGYGSSVVSAACADLLARGRTPRLMYHRENSSAGRLYARLGFEEAGRWLMARIVPAGGSRMGCDRAEHWRWSQTK